MDADCCALRSGVVTNSRLQACSPTTTYSPSRTCILDLGLILTSFPKKITALCRPITPWDLCCLGPMRMLTGACDPMVFPIPVPRHQLLPSMLTCVVGKTLSATAVDDHWSLRKRAAGVVGTICVKFGKKHRVQVSCVRCVRCNRGNRC